MNTLRGTIRWTLLALLLGRVALVLCLAYGAAIPVPVMHAVEASLLAPAAALAVPLSADYRRHRRDGMTPRAAAREAVRDAVPVSLRRLTVHEVRLLTSFCRWLTRRPPHGVGPGDLAVRYATGQSFVFYGFLFVSVVETVALALLIPWPVVHAVFLVVDIWGCYFVIALHASCAVHPHVVAADGSLRLRYGVLLEIRVPAELIARARLERRYPTGGRLAQLHDDGALDLSVGGQTTVTVQLSEPVRFVRPLGKEAEARVLRFYADDPAPTVTALTASTQRTDGTPAPPEQLGKPNRDQN
ncbi:hypothetical protein ACFOSC_13375 [Streptantibioticus rubrisoli]|uniref:Integral membrane protein n=1 Tax=Streptantibioticus rubrisoli TaxID=1387313 RepID=A0ABT1PCH2_9ACTN|nr:hypothetical protein [Streptantibioticus rubrisoli]MCQ4043073.1 hypothetical protein [Streptantibioticus rubrisoli]